MSSLLNKILRQAFKTFDRSNQGMFSANFKQLKQMTEQLTFQDIQLNEQILIDVGVEKPGKAPCTFIHIFENDIVSLSVFVVRGGYTMPLHDHPMMYGLLRGICGQLCVQCYSQQFRPNEEPSYDENVKDINVRAEEPCIVSINTECAVLTPRERNFHEITALEGVAAFFDILSPPYKANMPVFGSRECRFYSPKYTYGKNHETLIQLESIPAPISYYCDSAEAPEAVADCQFAKKEDS